MKTFHFFYVLMLLIMLSVAMTACGNDGDEGDQSRTEVVPDPEGTVTQNVWWKDAWTQENLGIDGVTVQCIKGSWTISNEWYPDAKIASVGPVKGLGNITTIPTKGWSQHIACEVNHGYVVNSGKGTYARIFVVKKIDYGVQVKFEFPFEQ